MHRRLPLSLVLLSAIAYGPVARSAPLDEPALRRPVGLARVGTDQVIVANRSGSISSVNVTAGKVTTERQLGKRFSDATRRPGSSQVLVTDQQAGQLLVVDADTLQVATRTEVSPTPVSVRVTADGKQAFVASLWTRQLSIVELASPPKVVGTLDLPFSPREQLLVRDDAILIVADSFGGRLALIDTRTKKLVGLRELPATNIRGLGISADGKKLLVSHQILSNLAETTHNDIHWGVLVTNIVRWLDLQRVLTHERDILKNSHVHLLGDPGQAAGDPAGMAITSSGKAVVALSGVGELAIADENEFVVQRVTVSRRPWKVALSADEQQAYVINQFSDSLSIVDLDQEDPVREIPLGEQSQRTAKDRGEELFFDARLSMEGWMSCQTCHTDGHSNHALNDNMSDGSFGAAKRILSLLGVADTGPWAWNGDTKSLADQVTRSVRSTMLGPKLTDSQLSDLVAYLKSLRPPPSREKLLGIEDRQAINRGQTIFHREKCSDCHSAPNYTSADTYDVGLKDKRGNRRFNPPSLRGVGQRGPLFHDNRAANLNEVLERFQHQLSNKLTPKKRQDLIHFLNSL